MSGSEHDRKTGDGIADDKAPELSDEQLDKTSGGGGSKDSVYLSLKFEPETIRLTTQPETRNDDLSIKIPKAD